MLDDKQFHRNLKKALEGMKKNTIKGIRLSTAFVKLEAQKLTPVDEGNLKNSAYTSVSTNTNFVIGEIGYTAYYAVYVHEAPMTLKGLPRPEKGFYWDPQGTASNKFLQKAFYGNKDKIMQIMQASISL